MNELSEKRLGEIADFTSNNPWFVVNGFRQSGISVEHVMVMEVNTTPKDLK